MVGTKENGIELFSLDGTSLKLFVEYKVESIVGFVEGADVGIEVFSILEYAVARSEGLVEGDNVGIDVFSNELFVGLCVSVGCNFFVGDAPFHVGIKLDI